MNRTLDLSNIMPFWGFWADLEPPKEGFKSAQIPSKRHNAIEPRLKKRKKIASLRRFLKRGSITQDALCCNTNFMNNSRLYDKFLKT